MCFEESDSVGLDSAYSIEVLAIEGLAQMLGFSVRTIQSMDAEGEIPRPYVLLTGQRIWVFEEIEFWIEEGRPSRKAWEDYCHRGRELAELIDFDKRRNNTEAQFIR